MLNKISREKLQADSVELAFDNETNTIRIRAVPEGQTIKKTKVFARGFFNHFGINKKGRYEARFDEEERALYVNLA